MANQSFGRYIVDRSLGRGGMAEVYLARDTVLERQVAIKIILPHLAAEEGFIERFWGEAKLIASLRHPHLIQLFDIGVLNDQPFMVMEYLNGGTLKDRLVASATGGTPMALGDIVRLLDALASAIDYAHEQGAIHRDIKPANILFAGQNEPVLADFGLARLQYQSSQISQTGAIVGTPAYMSPEQAGNQTLDKRSDLYALGVVIYQLATGRLPFRAESPTTILLQHLNTPPPPPRRLNPNLPIAVEAAILQALAKLPEDRFASAGAFASAFRAAVVRESMTAMPDDATLVEPTPAPITVLVPQPTPVLGPPTTTTDSTGFVVVAREEELAGLENFLRRALSGQGQVCFVSGEAGAGKTALVNEFVRRASQRAVGVLTAIGTCNFQSGVGDPYLPFRELLTSLAGAREVDEEAVDAVRTPDADQTELAAVLGQMLVEHGPDLLGIMVSDEALAAILAKRQPGSTEWINQIERLIRFKEESIGSDTGPQQSHIFEQYSNLLRTLAEQQPMLLVLDDLQWADGASIELLFHLGRRISDSRIMIVGTYRPEDIALGRAGSRHPLETVLNEFKRYLGDVEISLRQTQETKAQQFVDALLDSQPNQLGRSFRDTMLAHTGGHALFTVELLRNMQERGDLRVDDTGLWVEAPTLDWNALPPRVEGVIDERIGRLTADLREALTIASVEGEDFTAEVVARVQNVDARGLIRRLSNELDRQHRLIGAKGLHHIAGQRLSLYRFRHSLFQNHLYRQLSEVERAYLHEDVGSMLEDLYGDDAEGIAVQLAWHFTEARLSDKARHYLYLAGEQARRQYAHEEALSYFNRALELTPETEAVDRYVLLIARVKVFELQGARQAQYEDLVTLEALADSLDDAQRRAEIALTMSRYANAIGDYAESARKAKEALELASADQNEQHKANGYLRWGVALAHQSCYAESGSKLQQALVLSTANQLRQIEGDCLRALGVNAYFIGDYASSIGLWEQALKIYQGLGYQRGEGAMLSNLGLAVREQGRYGESAHYFDRAMHIYRAIGDKDGEGQVLANLGLIARDQGDFTASLQYYQDALEICQQVNARGYEATSLYGLGGVYRENGEFDKAAHVSEQALLIFREIGDRRFEHLALKDLANIAMDLGDYSVAYDRYQTALTCFHEIGDRQSESDALNQLAELTYNIGDEEKSRDYSRRAMELAEQIGDPWLKSEALTCSGNLLANLGQPKIASEHYQQAVSKWREQNRPDLALKPLAGLARVALSRGDLPQALDIVEDIYSQLTDDAIHTTHVAEEYLTCFRVLEANQDPRAVDVLSAAYSHLQKLANKIKDEQMRFSYMHNVPSHREIVSAWQELRATKPDDRSDDITAVGSQ